MTSRKVIRPRFIIVNGAMLALLIAASRLGLFSGIPTLAGTEVIMLLFLAAYALMGAVAAWNGAWRVVSHIANSLPMWALGFTGLGILLSVNGLHDLSQQALINVFRNLALAICPNILGVCLMAWLREIGWWVSNEEI